MKMLSKLALAAALAAGFAGAATAQPPGGGRGQGGGFGMMGGMGGANVYNLLATNKELIAELKITDEQKVKLEEVAKAAREKMTGGGGARLGRDASDEERKAAMEKMQKMQAEIKADYEKVLDEKQKIRATQISYQAMGVRAYANKDVQEALKLTDDQKEQVKTMMDDYTKESGELMRGAFSRDGGGDRAEMQKKMEEMRKKTTALGKEVEEKIAGKLTADQKAAWTKLIGDKFDTTKLVPAPRQRRDD